MLQKGEPKALTAVSLAAVALVLAGLAVAVVHFHMPVKETYWALTPPVIAIALALITKEVYSSLFLGILTGAFLNAGFDLVGTLNQVFTGGIIKVLADKWNVGILIFLVILGMMVQLMNRAGGSAAFGRWASSHITTRKGAQLATMVLGCLIFIDDYFNCLTVGSVMRPVCDKSKISRAKLAYLIDATAAPVCIIAPVSSWAAAVSSYVEEGNGLHLFIRAIPFNFYAILTIVAMGVTVVTVLLMWMTCIFGHISPAGFGWYGVVTLLFPIFAVANAVLDRAARLVCANLSAVLQFINGGRDPEKPVCIGLWGDALRHAPVRKALERHLETFTRDVLGHHVTLCAGEEMPAVGSAAVALYNT